jgi:hypothetical protein
MACSRQALQLVELPVATAATSESGTPAGSWSESLAGPTAVPGNKTVGFAIQTQTQHLIFARRKSGVLAAKSRHCRGRVWTADLPPPVSLAEQQRLHGSRPLQFKKSKLGRFPFVTEQSGIR